MAGTRGRGHGRTTATLAGALAAVALLAASLATTTPVSAQDGRGAGPSGAPSAAPSAATPAAAATPTTCVPGSGGLATAAGATAGTRSVTGSDGESYRVASRPVGEDPAGMAVDATDTWGRVAVAVRGADALAILYGRSPALTIECVLPLDGAPSDVAVDDATGLALVTLADAAALAVVDLRADPVTLLGTVGLPAPAGHVTIDAEGRRAYATLPEAGTVALLVGDGGATSGAGTDAPVGWRLATTVPAGEWPQFLALDPARGRLIVAAQGQPPAADADAGKGRILVFAVGTDGIPAPAAEPIPASVPTGVAIDPGTGTAAVLENGDDAIASIVFPEDGGPPAVTRTRLPGTDEGQNLNPVALVLLPATRELVATLSSSVADDPGHLARFRLDDAGRAIPDGEIPAARRTRGIALDPVTGRVLVTEVAEGRVAAYGIDEPSAPPPPPASIAESLPGPLEVSLAPEDVARTVGLSLLVLLLVGAPTPLFNETLELHVDEIAEWARRLLRRGRRRPVLADDGTGAAHPAAATTDAGHGTGAGALLGRIGAALRALTTTPGGIVLYTGIGALIYSFLTPGFPAENGLLVFAVTFIALGLAMAADIIPGDRYAFRRFGAHGRPRVAIWTLVLAAGCVLVSRMASLNPGFMYGIIGTFTFSMALTRDDEGKMEARGAVALLALALGSWVLRIPFQPEPGVPASGPGSIVNAALVGVFVVSVENLVFGLIPLRFMPGQRIFDWSKRAWLVLWGAGLILFAHVLVYPVTLAQPSPDPAQLQVTLVSVAIYGVVAIGLWAAFRIRAARMGGPGTHVALETPPADEGTGAS